MQPPHTVFISSPKTSTLDADEPLIAHPLILAPTQKHTHARLDTTRSQAVNFRLNEGRLPLCRLQGLGQQREHPTRKIISIHPLSAAFSLASAFRRLVKDIECWRSHCLDMIQLRRFQVRLASTLQASTFLFRHLRQIRADLNLSNVISR